MGQMKNVMSHSLGDAEDDWARHAQDGPILIFQHLAKTAGTTLGTILQKRLPADRQLRLIPGHEVTALGTWPHTVIKSALQQCPSAALDKIRFVGGHLGYGVHRLLPRPSKYVSILREPVDRVLSGFFYSIDKHISQTGEQVTLRDYVFRKRHYDLGLNNYQTRLISGLPELDPFGQVTTENARPITPADLDVAIANLRRDYVLAGLTERFDEFLVILARLLGWPLANVTYTRQNVTPNRPGQNDLPPDIIAEIRRNNILDTMLYEAAGRLHEQRMAEYGVAFHDDLKQFRALLASHARA